MSRSIAVTMRIAAILLASAGAARAEPVELTVMSFNVWGGGGNAQKPVDETVAVIRAAGADIIGLQETRLEPDPCTAEDCRAVGESVAARIAEKLGFHYYDQTRDSPALWANAIISRYPIGKPTGNDLGVAINVAGRTVMAYNIHLTDFPYQPYQLLGIEYGTAPFLKTGMQAEDAAAKARGPALDLLMTDLREGEKADAAFVFGDFNEPSWRDWTEASVNAGRQPVVVNYPSARRVEEAGFTDLFRAAFPDPVSKPGFTWTPTSPPEATDDHHDRIDFTFGRAAALKVLSAGIVGEKTPEAYLVVTPWPSDHRATMAKVRF